jgi:hypothetical protein
LGVGAGFYALSHPSYAETQYIKTVSDSDNRELASRASRKQSGKPGKAENETRGSIQDHKANPTRSSNTPVLEAGEDSETGKTKGGHDEKGPSKDERVKNQSEEADAVQQDGEEDEEYSGPQAIGMNSEEE